MGWDNHFKDGNDESYSVDEFMDLKKSNEALLEACRSALRHFESYGDEDIHKYILAELRQAIAKAEGR